MPFNYTRTRYRSYRVQGLKSQKTTRKQMFQHYYADLFKKTFFILDLRSQIDTAMLRLLSILIEHVSLIYEIIMNFVHALMCHTLNAPLIHQKSRSEMLNDNCESSIMDRSEKIRLNIDYF